MAIREIIEVPDPRLKTVSTPVEPHEFNDELKTLVEDMFETMYDAPGIGLAAIQVAVPKRVLVIDLQEPDMDADPIEEEDGTESQPVKNDPRVYINPVIVNPADVVMLQGWRDSREALMDDELGKIRTTLSAAVSPRFQTWATYRKDALVRRTKRQAASSGSATAANA